MTEETKQEAKHPFINAMEKIPHGDKACGAKTILPNAVPFREVCVCGKDDAIRSARAVLNRGG